MNYLKKVQLTADDLLKALHWHFICGGKEWQGGLGEGD